MIHIIKFNLFAICRNSEVALCLLKAGANPNCVDNEGSTPLSIARNSQCIRILVKYGANPSNLYQACKEYLPADCPQVPEDSAVNVFIVGYSGAGKSTLVESMKKSTKGVFTSIAAQMTKMSAEKKTAGIKPHTMNHPIYGKTQIYDLAGDEDFYSSHDAIISSSISGLSSAVFILVVDLQLPPKEIGKAVLYWLNFLQAKIPSECLQLPHLICVGSHLDLAGNMLERKAVFDAFLPKASALGFSVSGFIPMNCQNAGSAGMDRFRHLLSKSTDSLRIVENMPFHAHCFHVFLVSIAKEKPAFQLKAVQQMISCNKESDKGVLSFLPITLEGISSLCHQLSERNHILFLRGMQVVEDSWVILDQAVLLSRVNGIVFASEGFRTYCELATSTGVVPLSKIAAKFNDLDPSMITQYLTHLHYCIELSQETLILLQPSASFRPSERYFLFPSLVRELQPTNVWAADEKYVQYCGWEIECSKPEQSFTPRFLHLLLLRIAFQFALEPTQVVDDVAIHRLCSIWKNGIHWESGKLVSGLVEVTDHWKKVTILVRCQEGGKRNILPLLSAVVREVFDIKEEVCCPIIVTEHILHKDVATSFPPVHDAKKPSVVGTRLAEAILLRDPAAVNLAGEDTPINDIIPFEPNAMQNILFILKGICQDDSEHDQVIPLEVVSGIIKNIQKNSFFLPTSRTGQQQPCLLRQCLLKKTHEWADNNLGTYRDLRTIIQQYGVFSLLVSTYMYMLNVCAVCRVTRDYWTTF